MHPAASRSKSLVGERLGPRLCFGFSHNREAILNCCEQPTPLIDSRNGGTGGQFAPCRFDRDSRRLHLPELLLPSHPAPGTMPTRPHAPETQMIVRVARKRAVRHQRHNRDSQPGQTDTAHGDAPFCTTGVAYGQNIGRRVQWLLGVRRFSAN